MPPEKKWCVVFKEGQDHNTPVYVKAFTQAQAKILAQAERIKAGKSHTVLYAVEDK